MASIRRCSGMPLRTATRRNAGAAGWKACAVYLRLAQQTTASSFLTRLKNSGLVDRRWLRTLVHSASVISSNCSLVSHCEVVIPISSLPISLSMGAGDLTRKLASRSPRCLSFLAACLDALHVAPRYSSGDEAPWGRGSLCSALTSATGHWSVIF